MLAVAILAVCILVAGGRGVAAAATGVVAAEPASGASLAGTPGGLRMEFVAPIEAHFLVLEFWEHGQLTSLPARIDPTNPQAAIAALRRAAGAPGRAWVRYRVLTADGHVFAGTYPVEIGTGGPAGAAPRPLTASGGAWLTGLARGLVLAGLVVGGRTRRVAVGRGRPRLA